jgi:hypothetical protein
MLIIPVALKFRPNPDYEKKNFTHVFKFIHKDTKISRLILSIRALSVLKVHI